MVRAFAHLGVQLIHLAYLDEFGHVGPYVSRSDRRHNDSPVFGFAGFVMPVSEVRAFGTWFFQRKRELLDFEIRRSGKHPAVWEKKGSSLYRAANLSRYRGLRKLTGRLLARIERSGGYVFHAGIRKTTSPGTHDANALYSAMLRESIGRLDVFCREDCDPPAHFLLALDEHPRRAELLTAVGRDMYGGGARRQLVEPPFHLESHRYQTVQAADWVAALVGRIEAFRAEPDAWPENEVFDRYFGRRLAEVQVRSGISG